MVLAMEWPWTRVEIGFCVGRFFLLYKENCCYNKPLGLYFFYSD